MKLHMELGSKFQSLRNRKVTDPEPDS